MGPMVDSHPGCKLRVCCLQFHCVDLDCPSAGQESTKQASSEADQSLLLSDTRIQVANSNALREAVTPKGTQQRGVEAALSGSGAHALLQK